MILSIVIPVYNVEKYIEKCLLSCIHQDVSYNDYEIIVVNDGSLDNSLTIAERITSSLINVRIVSQSNLGLSAARNKGLSLVRGEFVWFIDSDDWIEENSLGRIISMLKNQIDILQLQYRKVYENGKPNVEVPFCYVDGTKSGEEMILLGGLPAPAQFSIYRTEFLRTNSLRFYEGILHEDSEFKPRATYLAKSIIFDTKISYNYLQRESGSITSVFKVRNAYSILIVMNNIIKFMHDYNIDKKLSQCFYGIIGMNMNSLLIGYRQLNTNEKKYLINLLKENRHLFLCMMKSSNIKYKIEGLIFYINAKIGFYFHSLLR